MTWRAIASSRTAFSEAATWPPSIQRRASSLIRSGACSALADIRRVASSARRAGATSMPQRSAGETDLERLVTKKPSVMV